MEISEESLKIHRGNQRKLARSAIETGVARITVDPEEVRAKAVARIKNDK